MSARIDDALLRWSEAKLTRTTMVAPQIRDREAFVREDVKGHAQVVISALGSASALLPKLQAFGFALEVASDNDRDLQGRISPGDLVAIAQVEGVRFVAPPSYGVPDIGAKTTQGDASMKSDALRSILGATGAGVSVGVVQMGAAGYAQSQASGDLPNDLVLHSVKADGSFSQSESEGRAMLEIIHDVAPDAKLYYAEFDTSLEFIAAYNWLSDRCQVIVDDISFFNLGPYDGTSAVSRGVAAVVSKGVAAFGSVGNRAQQHTSGTFSDPDGDGYHNFSGADELQSISVSAGDTLAAHLQWNEPFGGATGDYDLFLFDLDVAGNPQITSGVTGGQNIQNGTQNPTEDLYFTNSGTSARHVGLAIYRWPGGVTRSFDIFFTGGTVNEYAVSAGSVPNKGDAGGGFVSVGAAYYAATSVMESYSSRGPTKDGRMKPEITAPDCVTTTVSGFAPFCGTSAAAPHVAAVAALLLSRNRSLTPAQVLTALESTAVDIAPPGPDNDSGYGFVDALRAGQSVPAASGVAASFTFSPASPFAGQTIQFTDTSTGSPTSWSWNFGDGLGSAGQNPSHSFFGADTYQVALTVANSGGSNTMTKAVVVNRGGAAGCIADAYTMCFGNGRYRVTSSWQNQYVGDKIPTSLRKTAFTDIVGAFWIDAGAYQYFVSVNPATSGLNGHTWVAINTFSGVEFWIDVTDTVSGLHKTYHNPPENKTLVEDRTFFVFP